MSFDHKTYNRERYQRLRAKYIEQLGGKCVTCGSADDLEFDHADRTTKSLTIGRLLNYSQEVVEKELSLCVLLCHDCHVAKSKEAGDLNQVEHGGGASGKRNCKCEPCKAKKNEYMRAWKRNRKNAGGPG